MRESERDRSRPQVRAGLIRGQSSSVTTAGRIWERAAPTLVWLAAFAYVVVLSAEAISAQRAFVTGFDTALYDQYLWLIANGHDAFSTIVSKPMLADHFQPGLVLLTPLYWLGAGVPTLLVVQSAALAATGPALYALARASGARPGLAAVPALLWIACPFVARLNLWEFRPTAFVSVLLVLSVLGAVQRRYWLLGATAVVALSLKEDTALVYLALGIVLALRGQRRLGGLVAAASVVWLVVASLVVEAGGDSSEAFARRFAGDRGDSMREALVWIVRHPLETASDIASDSVVYLAALVVATGGLALLAPLWLLLALPTAAHNALSAYEPQHLLSYHYHQLTMTGLFIAAALGVHRLQSAGRSLRVAAGAGVAARRGSRRRRRELGARALDGGHPPSAGVDPTCARSHSRRRVCRGHAAPSPAAQPAGRDLHAPRAVPSARQREPADEGRVRGACAGRGLRRVSRGRSAGGVRGHARERPRDARARGLRVDRSGRARDGLRARSRIRALTLSWAPVRDDASIRHHRRAPAAPLRLRGSPTLFFPERPSDERNYVELAHNLLDGHFAGLGWRPATPYGTTADPANPDLWFGPGLPAALTPLVALDLPIEVLRLTGALFLFGAVLVFYRLLRLYVGVGTSLLGAYALGLYFPFFVLLSTIHSEPLAILLLVSMLYLLSRYLHRRPACARHRVRGGRRGRGAHEGRVRLGADRDGGGVRRLVARIATTSGAARRRRVRTRSRLLPSVARVHVLGHRSTSRLGELGEPLAVLDVVAALAGSG